MGAEILADHPALSWPPFQLGLEGTGTKTRFGSSDVIAAWIAHEETINAVLYPL